MPHDPQLPGAVDNEDVDALADSLVAWTEAHGLGAAAPAEAVGDDDEQLEPATATIDAGDDVLTVEEVAALLKLGRNSVYDAVGRREIPHARIGKQIRFSRAAIMRWLSSCEAADKEHR